MPVYEYGCGVHGIFEDIKKISDREKSNCPNCGIECELVMSTNDFMAKRYIAPPPAKRHLGEDRRRPPNRPKWV